jgi:carbon-monoxide dehydrogenase medium subunit
MRADRPKNLEELRAILANATAATRLIAGGTDLTLHIRSHPEEDMHLLDISHLEELRTIRLEGDILEIGAAVTFDELERSHLVRTWARCLAIASSLVGSPQIRNRGTIGGNVANASAAADGVPALCALEAEALIEDAHGKQESLPVEKIILGTGKTSVGTNRFIRSFRIPRKETFWSDFSKVGSRKAVTISKLNLALAGHLEEGALKRPRLFVGAVSSTPLRATEAEEILSKNDRSGRSKEDFLDALTAFVEATIPTRTSMPYKRWAIRGLGDDLWTRLEEVLSR